MGFLPIAASLRLGRQFNYVQLTFIADSRDNYFESVLAVVIPGLKYELDRF